MFENYNKVLESLLFPKRWWIPHIIFWIFIYLDEFLSIFNITVQREYYFYLETYISFVLDVITVYINLYILFPKFFLKNKIPTYLVLTFLTLFLNSFIIVLSDWSYYDDLQDIATMMIGVIITTTPILAMAVGIKIFKNYIHTQDRVNELETTNLKTELEFLKNQMNPHFLFNSLNNIYVQSRKRPTEAPDSILQLSDLLRYQLYDCSQEKVPLTSEIKYIDNYLKLDALRKNGQAVNMEVLGNPNGQQVAPFLFIPFVENAVKHGIGTDTTAFLNIKFEVAPKNLEFTIENSKPKLPITHEDGGIGLANVQRRLELLYPDRHDLNIKDSEKTYEVNLSLELN